MKSLITLLLFASLAISGNSQDTLFKKVGDPIICRVTEIGEEEVKYKTTDNPEGPSYIIDVAKLKYIRLANGTEHRFTDNQTLLTGPDSKALLKRNAIKLAPFTPVFGSTVLGYEHVQKFGVNWELEIGIIGIGSQDVLNTNERGAWIYAGPKLLFRKDTYSKGERFYHFLHGAYFRPELGFEYQTGREKVYNNNYDLIDSDYELTHFGLMLNVGKQWVLADIMTLDIWGGLGLASNMLSFDAPRVSSGYRYYSDVRTRSVLSGSSMNGDISLSARGGVKLGIIF